MVTVLLSYSTNNSTSLSLKHLRQIFYPTARPNHFTFRHFPAVALYSRVIREANIHTLKDTGFRQCCQRLGRNVTETQNMEVSDNNECNVEKCLCICVFGWEEHVMFPRF